MPEYQALRPEPFVEPVQQWFRKNPWSPVAAVVAQAVAAGMWTQERGHQLGKLDNAYCAHCAEAGIQVLGSAQHRLGRCPAFTEQRAFLGRICQHQAATSEDRLLWDRGLAKNPAARYDYKPQAPLEQWYVAPQLGVEDGENLLFTGSVASDGSKTGSWKDASCTGCGVSMPRADGDGTLLAAWGPLPHNLPVQRTIARCELMGVVVALENSIPPINILVDCALILTGVRNGEKWCTYSGRPHADVWKRIWNKLIDIGLGSDGVTFEKVKAHVSARAKAAATEADKKKIVSNEDADLLAKLGATLGENEFMRYIVQTQDETAEKIKGALDLIAGLANATLEEGDWPDVATLKRGNLKAKTTPDPPAPHRRPHVFEAIAGDGFVCKTCRRKVATTKARDIASRYDCSGHAAAPLQVSLAQRFAISNGHLLWMNGNVVWCSRCAMYTERQLKGLRTLFSGKTFGALGLEDPGCRETAESSSSRCLRDHTPSTAHS